ncbi:MAG TPA: PA0069 family radical SAM protein [Planctomycetota bacterium]|jgi:DNA repair photolyase|nr:PA0069 family radical SAM protein [Planctomycetota bacterium]
MDPIPAGVRGRGAATNPASRFVRLAYAEDTDPQIGPEEEGASVPKTLFFRDDSRSIVARNDSPDVGFEASVNPYRGCEHGCAYCYARPTHEYFGLSAGLDFETRIFVKEDAAELLRKELASSRWKPQVLAMSGVTDPYQPVERRLGITRRCLEVLVEYRNPVAIVTKSALVTRDLDLLAELARHRASAVFLSVTTLDRALARDLEPRAATPAARLEAVEAAAKAGVPVGVMVAPVIPGLTDHEIPAILEAAARAGARFAGYTMLRLPGAVAGVFEAWLAAHRPTRKERVLNRVREIRDGRLNDPRFGSRMRGEGPFADLVASLFEKARRRVGLSAGGPDLSTAAFRRPGASQGTLFEDPKSPG